MSWSRTNKAAGALALALMLAAIAVVGFAQGRGGFSGGQGKGGDQRVGFGRMFRSVDLTQAQRTQVEQIAERHRQSTAQLREQLKANREGRADAVDGGTFNEQAVRSAAQARAAAQVELEVAHARMFSEMYAVLTPEQKAQLAAERQQRQQERQQRRNSQQGGAAAPTTEQ